MALINSIFGWYIKKRIHQIELFIKYPHDVQNDWFQQLMARAKHTEWGSRYGYADIKTYDEYKRRVPIQEYDGFKKDIDRIIRGEQNVL